MKRSSKPSGAHYRKLKKLREAESNQSAGAIRSWLNKNVDQNDPNEREERESLIGAEESRFEVDASEEHEKSDESDSGKMQSGSTMSEEVEIAIETNAVFDMASSDSESERLQHDNASTFSRVSVLSDVSMWPRPITDKLRMELVQHGTKDLQHADGPFEADESSRSLTKQWFTKTLANGDKVERQWLLYSPVQKAAFCFCCSLFSSSLSSQGGVLPAFANESGFKKWRKLNPRVIDHENSPAHKSCYLKWKELEMRTRRGALVNQAMEDEIQKHKKKWHEIINRLLDVILFLSKQNLAFRGHREDADSGNRGNFLELVSLLGNYDAVIRDHLTTMSLSERSISYLSPQIQNELICIFGNAVHQKIVTDIKEAKYFTLIADSTPDRAHVDQMSIIIRYVMVQTNFVEVRESFYGFFQVKGKTAKATREALLESLEKDGIRIKDCRGQAYDNASTMSGVHNGVQAQIKDINPLAMFVPCTNHSLNLVCVHAAEVCPDVITFFGTLDRLFAFFSMSTGRWEVMKKHLSTTVKRHTVTRWSSKAEAVRPVAEQYENVILCLEELKDSQDNTRDTRGDAGGLLENLMSFKFLVFLNFWAKALPEINRIQLLLQGKQITLRETAVALQSLEQFFTDKRDHLARSSVQEAEKTCEENDIAVQKRTRRRRRMDGEDHDECTLSVQEEYEREIKAVIDAILTEMSSRFTQVRELNAAFGFLLHPFDQRANDAEFSQGARDLSLLYPAHFNDAELIEEYSAINRLLGAAVDEGKLDKEVVKCYSALDLLKFAASIAPEAFPNYVIALKLCVTIAVSVATAERSFSKLKLLMTYLRATMGHERLSSLATLSIERRFASNLDFSAVIEEFASRKARKANF